MTDDRDRESVLSRLLAQLHAFPGELTITLSGSNYHGSWHLPAERKMEVPSSVRVVAVAVNERKTDRGAVKESPYLSELDAAILGAFPDERQRLTGEKIAAIVQYPYASQLKMALASLHRMRLLTNHSPGYSRTPAGSLALEDYRADGSA